MLFQNDKIEDSSYFLHFDNFFNTFYNGATLPYTHTEQLVNDMIKEVKYVEPKKEKIPKIVKVKPKGKNKLPKRKKPPPIIVDDLNFHTSAVEPNYRNRYRGNLDAIYGRPETIHAHPERYLRIVDLPYKLRLAWNLSLEVGKIRVHKKEADRFRALFDIIHKEFNSDEIHTFGLNLYGGSYNYRKIRGGDRFSTHAYGIAIDLNPASNGLKVKYPKATFSKQPLKGRLKKITDSLGIINLGFSYGYDYMHFQTARR